MSRLPAVRGLSPGYDAPMTAFAVPVRPGGFVHGMIPPHVSCGLTAEGEEIGAPTRRDGLRMRVPPSLRTLEAAGAFSTRRRGATRD